MKKPRSIRVSDELWSKVKLKAAKENTTITQIVINALRHYVSNKAA
jgi:predicted transcriptional regulator